MGDEKVLLQSSTVVTGEDLLSEARAAIRELRPLGARVPAMRIKGDWKMNGFDFSFGGWEDAYPPLGNLYLKAGEKKAFVQPTANSTLEIFFVVEGDAMDAAHPNAEGDLFEITE